MREREDMKLEKSLESVPVEMTADPLWRMEVYRLAIFAGELGWHGATRLSHDKRTGWTIRPTLPGRRINRFEYL